MINRWLCHQLFRWLRCFASNTCHSHAAKWRPTDAHTCTHIHRKTTIHCDLFSSTKIVPLDMIFWLHNNFLLLLLRGPFCLSVSIQLSVSRSHSLELFNFASVVRRPFPILFWIKAFNYWKHLFWIFQLNVSLFIFPLLFISARSLRCFDSVEINRLWVRCVAWSWVDVPVCLFNSTHQPKPFSFNFSVCEYVLWLPFAVCCGLNSFFFPILSLLPRRN